MDILADEHRAVILPGEGMLDTVVITGIADRFLDFLQGNSVIRPQGSDRQSFHEVGETDSLGPVIRDATSTHRFG